MEEAMRFVLVLTIVIIFLFSFSCTKNELIVNQPISPSESGIVKISFNDTPSNITNIIARLSRSGFEDRSLVLSISDSDKSASGTFNNVPIGIWHLKVDALDNSHVVQYTGETDVDVIPGDVTIVELELIPTSGSIEIHVTWGTMCVPLPDGAISWWRGEDNTNDFISGNNGYIENGTTFVRGKVGKAFYFDGVDDRLRIPDAENLKITGSLTIECWIYIESFPYSIGQIFFRGDDRNGHDPYTLTLLSNENLQLVIWDSTQFVDLMTPVNKNKFIHVAGTLDSTTGEMKLYVDGVLKAEKTTTLRPFRDLDSAYSPGLGIGNTSGTGFLHNHPFHGIIDELTIYNRALSGDEIKAIYKAGSAGKCRG